MNMKYLIALPLLCISSAHAVIVSASSGFDIAFEDSGGLPISNGTGYISSGFFSGLADEAIANSIITEISAAYRPFTTTVAQFGRSGIDGFFDYTSSPQRVDTSSEFFGENLYLVFGNGSSLLTSTELAVFKSTELFPDDSTAAADALITVKFGGSDPSPGQFLMGRAGGETTVSSGGQSVVVPALQTVQTIPEPSTALLSLLGLGFLMRRRRG